MNLFFGKSDIGKQRKTNQDQYCVKDFGVATLLLVCDGMGGTNGGSVASALAVTRFSAAVSAFYSSDRSGATEGDYASMLAHAVYNANREVYNRAKSDSTLSGMGTTLVCALIVGDTTYVVNVGDSRLYLFADGDFRRITKDHSLVQHLIDSNKLTEEEAKSFPNRNIITRAIGVERTVEADIFSVDHLTGNRRATLLLCSDGLCGYVDEQVIRDTMQTVANGADTPEHAVCALIDRANEAGGNDNVTVIIGANTVEAEESLTSGVNDGSI